MPRTPTLTSDLTTAVRRALFWPAASTRMTNAELLGIANELVGSDLFPAVRAARDDILTTVWDIALHAGTTFDEPSGYPMPSESMVPIESVHYVAPDGAEDPLTQVDETEYWQMRRQAGAGSQRPLYYAMRGGQLHVLPHPASPPAGAKVRVRMVARPLELAEHSAPNLYLEIDQAPALASGAVRLNVADAGLLSSAWGTNPGTYDLMALASTPPHVPTDWYAKAHVTVNEGSDYVDVDTDNWTRGATLTGVPGRAGVGDFVVAGYQTPIVQLPVEAYKLLIHGVVAEVALALKMRETQAKRQKAYDDGLEALPGKLAPRVQGQSKTFVNHGSPTRLRLGGRFRGWRWPG